MPRGSGGVRNGNSSIAPSPSDAICRMTAARFVRRISGSVNSDATLEVLLGVEPDRDAVARAPRPTRSLVRRGLRDRLDRQSLHLRAHRVPADARGAGVDDVADAGHGEARLGDVRREHHAPLQPGDLRRLEHLVLVGRREPAVERQHLGRRRATASGRVRPHRRPRRRGSRSRPRGTRARRRMTRARVRRGRRGCPAGRPCRRRRALVVGVLARAARAGLRDQRPVADLDRDTCGPTPR